MFHRLSWPSFSERALHFSSVDGCSLNPRGDAPGFSRVATVRMGANDRLRQTVLSIARHPATQTIRAQLKAPQIQVATADWVTRSRADPHCDPIDAIARELR